MKLWPFTRSGLKTFNEARKQWRWCSIGRRRHLSRRSIPGGSHADVSLMHEPLEVRKLLAISAGYDGNDLAITADAEGDAITLEFDGTRFKIYDASGLYDTYTTSGFSGNITASSTDASLNTSFTFAFDQTALPRALQIDASISSTEIGSAIESTSSSDISFGGLTTIAADISTPASINFGGDVVIFDDITLTATDVIVSGNVEAAATTFGMDDIGITWQESTAATTSSIAMVTPAGGSPQVWAAAVGSNGGIERFNPADGSSLTPLGYPVNTDGSGNFNLIPSPTGDYVYGVHYNPFSDQNSTSTYPSSIFQYRTDGTGYAALQLPNYDTRGYQYLTVADDGSFVLLSNGNKIYKIDTSTTWTSGTNNEGKILWVWTLPDSSKPNDYRYDKRLRINSIAITSDGSQAYAPLRYYNISDASYSDTPVQLNSVAVLDLNSLGNPAAYRKLQQDGGWPFNFGVVPQWAFTAPDSSEPYIVNTANNSQGWAWKLKDGGSQIEHNGRGKFYRDAVLSGDGNKLAIAYDNETFGSHPKPATQTSLRILTDNGSTLQHLLDVQFNSLFGFSDTRHGYNRSSMVLSHDGSYGAAATGYKVAILDLTSTPPTIVTRIDVEHAISSIELVETDTNSAVYVGGSNKVTKIHLAGDPEDGKLPPLPETSTLVVNASNLSHFGGSIGATNPLTGLLTDASGVTVLSGNVTTTGDHQFLDPVQLQADVDLLGTGFSALEAGATGSFHLNAFADSGTRIEGVSNLSSLATNTTISVNGTINTTGQQQYGDAIQLLGDTTLGGGSAILAGAIDGNNANLTLNFSTETAINNPGDSNSINNFLSNGPIALQGTIATTGSQTYASTLTLANDATIVAQSTNLTGGIAGNQKNLTLNVQNETLIDGTSVFDNLASIESIGPVLLNATVVTSGNQNYSGTVTLVGATTLVANGGEFSREIIGNGQDLTLNIANTITIEDGSGVNNLTSRGETILTGTINTTGNQTYQSNVTIEGDVTIDAGGDISFSSEVFGNQNESAGNPDLIINTQADTTFGGTVSNLASLTTDAGGSTIAKADITTTGNQTYNDEFVLNTSLTLTGGDASFHAGIDGDGNDLTLNFTGNATLDGDATPISGINNLTSLGGIATNGTITTSGAQSFEGNATLIGNTTLVGPSATLAGTFDGQEHDLTINYTSPTNITSSGGNITNFTSVGDVLLNTTDFETIGSQTFQGNVTLTGDTMLTGTSGSFANGLDGAITTASPSTTSDTTTIDGNSVFFNLNDLTSHGPVELGEHHSDSWQSELFGYSHTY